MKQMTKTIGLAALFALGANAASAATLFADNFNRAESNVVGNGWTELESGGGDVSIKNNRLRLRDNLGGSPDAAAATEVIDATGFENVSISFRWRAQNNNEATDTLHLSFAEAAAPAMSNEGAWAQVFTDSDADSVWKTETITLGAADDTMFNLMFWTQVSNGNPGNNEGFRIDNVVVTGDLISVVPLPASAAMLLAGVGGFASLRRRAKR